MRQLADFVDRMMVDTPTARGSAAARSGSATDRASRRGRALGVIGIPGDRRDEDQLEYGALAATAFDEIIVREDKNLRGRPAGESADNVIVGIRNARTDGIGRGARGDKILDELPAVRAALRKAVPGDLVVLCVDDAVSVYRETMASARRPGTATAFTDPGELSAPAG
jgi:cyanophycin synthetase